MPNKATDSIDKLSYTYDGNRLKAVDDAVTIDNVGDFYDNGQYFYLTGVPEYTYDANGNLIKDVHKGILSISYNQLNLPVLVDKTGGNYIQYQYDAAGNKRRQLEFKKHLIIKTTDFIGNFVYENAKPAWNNFDEGRVVYNTNGTYFAETYLKDHLGNIRIAFGFDGIKYAVRQVNSYYPFGGVKTPNTPRNDVHKVPTEYRVIISPNGGADIISWLDCCVWGYGETSTPTDGTWDNLRDFYNTILRYYFLNN